MASRSPRSDDRPAGALARREYAPVAPAVRSKAGDGDAPTRTLQGVGATGAPGASGDGGLCPVLQAVRQDLSCPAADRVDRLEGKAASERIAARRRQLRRGSP